MVTTEHPVTGAHSPSVPDNGSNDGQTRPRSREADLLQILKHDRNDTKAGTNGRDSSAQSEQIAAEVDRADSFIDFTVQQLRDKEITIETVDAGYPLVITTSHEFMKLLERFVNALPEKLLSELRISNQQELLSKLLVGDELVVRPVVGSDNRFRVHAVLRNKFYPSEVFTSKHFLEIEICPTSKVTTEPLPPMPETLPEVLPLPEEATHYSSADASYSQIPPEEEIIQTEPAESKPVAGSQAASWLLPDTPEIEAQPEVGEETFESEIAPEHEPEPEAELPPLLTRSQLLRKTAGWFDTLHEEFFQIINHLPSGDGDGGAVETNRQLETVLKDFEKVTKENAGQDGKHLLFSYALPEDSEAQEHRFSIYIAYQDYSPDLAVEVELVPYKNELLITPENPLQLTIDGFALHRLLLNTDGWQQRDGWRRCDAYDPRVARDMPMGLSSAKFFFDQEKDEWIIQYAGQSFAMSAEQGQNYPLWILHLLGSLNRREISLTELENLDAEQQRTRWQGLSTSEIRPFRDAQWLLITFPDGKREYLFAGPNATVGDRLDDLLRQYYQLDNDANIVRALQSSDPIDENTLIVLDAYHRVRGGEKDVKNRVIIEKLHKEDAIERLKAVQGSFGNNNTSTRVDAYAREVIRHRLAELRKEIPGGGFAQLAKILEELESDFGTERLENLNTVEELTQVWALPIIIDNNSEIPFGKAKQREVLEGDLKKRVDACIDTVIEEEGTRIITEGLSAQLTPAEIDEMLGVLHLGRVNLFKPRTWIRRRQNGSEESASFSPTEMAEHDLPIVYRTILNVLADHGLVSLDELEQIDRFFRFLRHPNRPNRGEDHLAVKDQERQAALQEYARSIARDKAPAKLTELLAAISSFEQEGEAGLVELAYEQVKREKAAGYRYQREPTPAEIDARVGQYYRAVNLLSTVRQKIRGEGNAIFNQIKAALDGISPQLQNPALIDIDNSTVDYLQACLGVLELRTRRVNQAYEEFAQTAGIESGVTLPPQSPPPLRPVAPSPTPARAVGAPTRPTFTQADVATYSARQAAGREASRALFPPEEEEEITEDQMDRLREYMQGEVRAKQEREISSGVDRILSKMRSGVIRQEQTEPVLSFIAAKLLADTELEEIVKTIMDPVRINDIRSIFQTNKREMSDQVFAEVLVQIAEQYYLG